MVLRRPAPRGQQGSPPIPMALLDKCLSTGHHVAMCRMPLRCLWCHGFRRLARDCRRPRHAPVAAAARQAATPRHPATAKTAAAATGRAHVQRRFVRVDRRPDSWIEQLDPVTKDKSALLTFKLSAWTNDPRCIPTFVPIAIEEAEVWCTPTPPCRLSSATCPIPPQEEDSPSRDSCRQRRRCLAKKPHLPSPSNSSQPRHNHNLPPISCLWIISVGTGVPFATNLVAGWLHPLSTSSLSNLLGSPLPLLIVAACYISLLDLLSRLHQETHIRLL